MLVGALWTGEEQSRLHIVGLVGINCQNGNLEVQNSLAQASYLSMVAGSHSGRFNDWINECMQNVLVVRILGWSLGYKTLLVSVWVRLPGLPYRYYSKNFFGRTVEVIIQVWLSRRGIDWAKDLEVERWKDQEVEELVDAWDDFSKPGAVNVKDSRQNKKTSIGGSIANKVIREALDLSGLVDMVPLDVEEGCREWLKTSVERMGKDQFTFLVVLIWNLWNRVNHLVHKGILLPIRVVVDYTELLSSDFIISYHPNVYTIMCKRFDRCKAPLASSHKINIDGAYISETDEATIGIMARNESGLMVDGHAQILRLTAAWALAKGIKMAVTNGWDNVTIKNDAIGVINRMLSPNNDRSLAALILEEAKKTIRLKSDFVICHPEEVYSCTDMECFTFP
ncbi:hypothetical protein GQ457_01G019980 [Hibiscus cannabinus]